MSNTIIQVENLGKKYLIKHQQQGSYTALRDVITEKVKSLGKRIISPWNHKQSSTNSTTEEFWALKDISFKVKQGEVIGIIGPNGAGKSTLLKIISRITEPTKGRIRINGRVASLLEVGTGFHPELTGRENIFLNGAILGMGKAEIKRKFDEIVTFAEVEKFLDTPVKRYSSGMYVRLAFAVAAHLEPEILLVDEVLAVGDAQFQKKCIGKMEKVGKEGRTVLFVSHNMNAVQKLCGKSALLEQGQLVMQGDTSEVIRNYLCDKPKQQMVNLYELPRPSELGTRARISRFRIRNEAGNLSNNFAFGEAFTLEIECMVMKDSEDISFLLGIDTLYEQRIVTITSAEVGKVFSASAGDIVNARLKTTNLLLKPGTYSLVLGLFSTNMGIDRIDGIGTIEIRDISYDSRFVNISQLKIGFFQVPHPDWDVFEKGYGSSKE